MNFHELRLNCLTLAATMAANGRLPESQVFAKANEFVNHVLSAPNDEQAARLKAIAKAEQDAKPAKGDGKEKDQR
jgi:hypothetical protein